MSKAFDDTYLHKVATVSNKMLEAGLRIPAPFDHNKNAKPRTEQQEKDISINSPESSFNNAGYWRNFWVAPNEKGVPTLFGQLDAVGDPTDPKTPAYKVSNANEEVSVSITDNFEDGLGRTWTDGILHVAFVHHAVVPDQPPIDKSTIVNMSMIEEGSNNESLIEELKTVLRKVKINLPSSTNISTFLRDLLVAANQVPDSANDTLEPVPVYMSIGDNDMALTEAQAKALVSSNTPNPATGKPFTMEDLGFKPKPPASDNTELLASIADKDAKINTLTSLANAFRQKVIDDTKAMVQKRISSLIAAGAVTKEYAEANLTPKVEFQMSIVDGKIADHPLEMVLSVLEANKPAHTSTPSSFPVDGVVQPNHDQANIDLSDDDMDKALASLQKDGYL